MLTIEVPIGSEGWDDAKGEFVQPEKRIVQLEHSLLSLSKWEAKYKKPFMSSKDITDSEMLDYIRFMTITKNLKPDTYDYMTKENFMEIRQYINDPATATTFTKENNKGKSRKIITSEVIYYWMIASNIPFDPCQKWHLNRLLTLIRVCGIENNPPKKMSQRELMSRNAALNAARRKQANSKG